MTPKTKDKEITISSILFWKMYNALRDAEGVLWECDGATNPEDEDLTESICDATKSVSGVLDKLQPIIKTLKEDETA
jgi:hypothetical protein